MPRRPVRRLPRAALILAWLAVIAGVMTAGAAAPAGATSLTINTDQLQTSPFMGLGVEFDPYDTQSPTTINWPLIEARLTEMHPGFLRVVEPATAYFQGYDASHNPVYRWNANGVQELLTILAYAQSQGIPVVLGDWTDPAIGGDARIPADFIQALRTTYGDTVVKYYNVINEPNDTSCTFSCWTGLVKSIASAFATAGLTQSVQIVGPDNEGSWDDDPAAAALDLSKGLDADNPLDGDSWLTDTATQIPSLIGAYDTHRYATISGVENGVYGDQVRARRIELNNLDTAAKPWFDGEVGLSARLTSPFNNVRQQITREHGEITRIAPSLKAELDPSATSLPQASSFVDDQPYITQFNYGTWMGDMMIQAIGAGLSGASAWDLDDAMHTGGGYGALALKQWGLWNTLAGQDGYPATDIAQRPWYYAWTILSNAFPSGAQPLALAGTGVAGLRVTAAKLPAGGSDALSIAAVNDSGTAHTITLNLPSLKTPLAMAQYEYFPTDAPADANGFPLPTGMIAAQPGRAITLTLPADGMVVLTSRGVASPIGFDDGTGTLEDTLTSWAKSRSHTGLKLASSDPAEYNDAKSRAVTAAKKKPGQLVYRAGQMTSFQLQAYAAKNPSVTAYGSADGSVWWKISLAPTQAAPALGGHQLLTEYYPIGQLPAATNQLKIQLGPGTSLTDVRIADARSGSACVPAGGGVTAGSILGVAPGATSAQVNAQLGVPQTAKGRVRSYCVNAGGTLAAVFNRAGVNLIATTGHGYKLGAVAIGMTQATLLHDFASAPLKPAGGGLYVSQTGIVYAVASGKVAAEGVALPALAANHGALRSAFNATGLT